MNILKGKTEGASKWIGVSAGALSAVCSGSMSFLVHSTSGRLPATEITFFRSLLSLLIVTPFMLKERKALFSARATELWFRSVASAISILCFAWNLQHTSIGFASILFNLTPIVVLMLGLFTKAIPTKLKHIISMALVAMGSCLCFFGAPIAPDSAVWIVGLTGALAAGASYTMLQRQSTQWSTPAVIWPLSWMSLAATLILKRGHWSLPTREALYPLLLIGAFGLATQLFVTVSLRESGLAIGTAMVPSGIGISVLLDAFTSHQFHVVPLGGVFIYLSGIIPLIAFRSVDKNSISSTKVDMANREAYVSNFRLPAIEVVEGLAALPGLEVTRYVGSEHREMTAIRCLRALCWPRIYEAGHSLEDDFDGVGIHWVVKQGDRLVAAARLTIHVDVVNVPDAHLFRHLLLAPIPSPLGYISRLVVHPEVRGRGFAKMLDQQRRDMAAELGCQALVAVWNPTSGRRRKEQLVSDGFVSLDGELALSDGPFGMSYVYAMIGIGMRETSTAGI